MDKTATIRIPKVCTGIQAAILAVFPKAQAIYLYGSYGTDREWPSSDVDIAILLPHAVAKAEGSLALHPLRFRLEHLLGRHVDLANLRLVSTVLQKEVVAADRAVYVGDDHATAEFELLTYSLYQKLNEERREILKAFRESGEAYHL